RVLKAQRLSQPRNAFVWIDLARLYVLLGQSKPAEQAIKIALALAPYDRFILRSASRFYLHTSDAEKGLALLRTNARTPEDPCLIAAELAVSTVLEKTPKFVTGAQNILNNGAAAPFHTSELACALGGLEMAAGKSRKANKLFETSLRAPTENA